MNRVGVRLIGPKPTWARTHGGEGGSHPANINDNPYAIGAINFTGDHPVVLTVDGPSLGGFVCPITIPSYDLWKIGQARPGNKIKFRRVTMDYVIAARKAQDDSINRLAKPKNVPRPFVPRKIENDINNRALLHEIIPTDSNKLKVQYRIAGDRYLMIEYGEPVMDINSRVRVHFLEEFLLKHKPSGLIDTIPGVRSLLVYYDNRKISLKELMQLLIQAEEALPNKDGVKLKGRVFELPLAFHDKWNREATERYMNTIRSEALYLPDNVEFVAKNNGLSSIEEVEKIVMEANYLVLGLGDVYLGAPCAVPLDPRHRLVVPKYNPSRTYTPEGAVGIGGMYMCIYPMESPGGYQLIGRTLPIWDTRGELANFSPEKPWLLDMFDQIRFKKVSEDELEDLRAKFRAGKMKLETYDEELCMNEYNKFLQSIEKETAELKETQRRAGEYLTAHEYRILTHSRMIQDETLKIAKYLADMVVNGPDHPGAVGPAPSKHLPTIVSSLEYPPGDSKSAHAPPRGFKNILDEQGPDGFVKAVLAHKGPLVTDTTLRGAHQSLLMTRMRTTDMVNVATAASHALSNAFSIEMWGGATFDVALRFLHECPWSRLAQLRDLIPNIPFQMLIRGANVVGYSAYPDNVVYKFCKQAKNTGIDIFRIFDSLNYIENMRLGIDAVGEAGGIIEASICYTGDICNPNETKYPLDYYLIQARMLARLGIHVLCIKDMAGLLKPAAATILIGALRKEFPDLPIHIHSHDTAGTAVATSLASVAAGAKIVDCCNDALSGLTSQGAMGAIISNFSHLPPGESTGVTLDNHLELTSYWEAVRRMYAPFESGQHSAGADVYKNQIPGGQYTNLFFQALSMGLGQDWKKIKTAYIEANKILGDIVKVTPSSKVVGDLASFMVSNKLTRKDVETKAKELNFPNSVIEFLQGYLGQPHGGFPEPFRTHVLKNKPRFDERPGLTLPPVDFTKSQEELEVKWNRSVTELDVMSHVLFPNVFDDYMKHLTKYGPTTNLPTPQFLAPMKLGEKVNFNLQGKDFTVILEAVSEIDPETGLSVVSYNINGEKHRVSVTAKSPKLPPFILRTGTNTNAVETGKQKKADASNPGSVGAPLSSKVVAVKYKVGDTVKRGDGVVVLSSMKLQLTVTAPRSGKISSMRIREGDSVLVGDLLFEIANR